MIKTTIPKKIMTQNKYTLSKDTVKKLIAHVTKERRVW
jgi:hypothetical protein